VIEIVGCAGGTNVDVGEVMRTIQISLGELIEAMHADLVETYGDEELALAMAQALGEALLAEQPPAHPKR
jgi:hypothetical protein